MSASHHASIPAWTWGVPLVASGLLGLKFAHVVPADAAYVLIIAGLLLGATVFAAVHHAEVLALKLGEPLGSILLAVAVTVIEVGLIVSIMLSGADGSDRVARDTVFAARPSPRIGLTIPAVALVSLMPNQQIALGVSQTDMTLLILTLYISALTLGAGRTTVLQGAVHLVIFAAFVLVSAVGGGEGAKIPSRRRIGRNENSRCRSRRGRRLFRRTLA